MLKLNFNLRHQAITLLNPGTIVATDSKNYLVANFNFISDDWEYPLTAVFTSDVEKIPYTILVGQSEELEENECFIPWEVLQSSGNVYVSVFCGDLHTTNTVKFKVVKSGYTEGEIPPPPTPTIYEQILQALDNKQPMLTAGDNITITEENVISASSGSNDYTELENKPSINNVTLSGNKTSDDLNLQDKLTAGDNITIEDNVISATGGVTDYDELENKPQINGVELTGNKTTFDLNIETGTDDYEELNNLPQIENYSPNQLETTNELKNTVSFYPFTSSVRDGKLRLRFDETTVIKNNSDGNTISSLNSPPEYIYNSFAHFQYAGARQIAPFINPKYNSLSLFDYRPTSNGWTQLLFWEDATTNKPKCAFRYTSHNSLIRNVQFKELGSQIVSGVVNANGTITFTDSEGNSFTTSGSNLVTSGNEQISMGYDDEDGFYFLFDDGQEEVTNGTD